MKNKPICNKVQHPGASQIPPKEETDPLDESKNSFSTFLVVMEISHSSRLVIQKKSGRERPVSSRLEFSEKIPANNFGFSDPEDKNSGSLN